LSQKEETRREGVAMADDAGAAGTDKSLEHDLDRMLEIEKFPPPDGKAPPKKRPEKEKKPDGDIKSEVKIMVPKQKTSKRGELRHEVEISDTLQKLAVKYNVGTGEIKRANKLFSDQIYGRKFLIIPAEED